MHMKKCKSRDITPTIVSHTEVNISHQMPLSIIDMNIIRNKEDPFITVCAMRRSGKSTLAAWMIINMKKHYNAMFLVTNSEDTRKEYHKYIHIPIVDLNGFDDPNTERIIQGLINYHRELERLNKDVPHVLIVFDDIIDTTRGNRNTTIDSIAVNGRHYHITCLYCFQYVKSVTPVIRSNSDFSILGQSDRIDVIKMYRDEWCSKLSMDEFKRMLDKLEQYQFLIFDCTGTQRQMYTIKAHY